ncbi:hypothetical protein ACQY0O_007418 [Thecaphora frezii]
MNSLAAHRHEQTVLESSHAPLVDVRASNVVDTGLHAKVLQQAMKDSIDGALPFPAVAGAAETERSSRLPQHDHNTLHTNRLYPGLKRVVSHRSPHGHSGSGAGLWLAGAPSRSASIGSANRPFPNASLSSTARRQMEEGDRSTDGATPQGPTAGYDTKMYHFPATLAGASTVRDRPGNLTPLTVNVLGLEGLDSPVLSSPGEVDLDLSFDYVSRLEADAAPSIVVHGERSRSNPTKAVTSMVEVADKTRKSLPTSPGTKAVRGMAAADWEKRKKAPPAPLLLRGRTISTASGCRTTAEANPLVPQAPRTFDLADGLMGRSAFSPTTANSLAPSYDNADGQPLPLTPLSATRRAAKLLPVTSGRESDDGGANVDASDGRSSPGSSGEATKRSISSGSTVQRDRGSTSASTRSTRRSRSNTTCTAGPFRPPPFAPPSAPLPNSPANLSVRTSALYQPLQPAWPLRVAEGAARTYRNRASQELEDRGRLVDLALQPSLTNLTMRSSSIASFQTAESANLESHIQDGENVGNDTMLNGPQGLGLIDDTGIEPPEPSPLQGSAKLSSTPMLLSASGASSSDKSSLSPASYGSPMTPFTPIFSPDSGLSMVQLAHPNDWIPEQRRSRLSILTSEGIRLSRIDALPSIYASELALVDRSPLRLGEVTEVSRGPKERRQTEQWILAQRQRRAELQRQEMEAGPRTLMVRPAGGAGTLHLGTITAAPSRERVSTAGSSDDEPRSRQVLVISTASSPSETVFGQSTFPFPVVPASSEPQQAQQTRKELPRPLDMDQRALSGASEVRDPPLLTRSRSGTTGPWPQSPLLLSPGAMASLTLPSAQVANNTRFEEDGRHMQRNTLEDYAETEKALFEPASHASTRVTEPGLTIDLHPARSQRSVRSASALQTGFGDQATKHRPLPEAPRSPPSAGFGLGLGLALDPASPGTAVGVHHFSDDASLASSKRALSEQDLRALHDPHRAGEGSPACADDVGSPYLAIDMSPDLDASDRFDLGKAVEVDLQRNPVTDAVLGPLYPPVSARYLGHDLGLGISAGASPLLLDDCRSPRTVSGKQHGSNSVAGLEARLGAGNRDERVSQAPDGVTAGLVVHRAVADLRPVDNKVLRESPSFASNISAFVYNPTPPSPFFHGSPKHPSNFVDLNFDPTQGKAAAAPNPTLPGDAGKAGWRTKLWNAVGSNARPSQDGADLGRSQSIKTMEESNMKRGPFRTLTLLSRRPSEPTDVPSIYDDRIQKAAGNARRFGGQGAREGPQSAPPTALLPSEGATFSTQPFAEGEPEFGGVPHVDLDRTLLKLTNQEGVGSGGAASSAMSKPTIRMGAMERKQKRNSGIAYIKDDGEMSSPWTEGPERGQVTLADPGSSASTSLANGIPAHNRRISLTTFGGKERAVGYAGNNDTASNPLDGLKSPRVAPSPSGFTPRMRFEPSDWNANADAPHQDPTDPSGTLAPKEPGTGLSLADLEWNRQRLQLLASQTISRATSRFDPPASVFSSIHAHYPAVARVQCPDPTFGLHRRSRTARFANELVPGLDEFNGDFQSPVTATPRPTESRAGSSATRIHTFGTSRSQGAIGRSNSNRCHSMLASTMPQPFATPSRYLESATPSKSMFWAGFLGMPWLWLIGGWWLDENGQIAGHQRVNRVEFWQHEPSMAPSSLAASPTLHQDELDAVPLRATPRGNLYGRAEAPRTLRSQNTMTSLSSHYSGRAPSVASSCGTVATVSVTHADPSEVPQSRSKSLASIINRRPEVAFYQSPVRIVEAPAFGNSGSRSMSRSNTPLAQLTEIEETLQANDEYERLRRHGRRGARDRSMAAHRTDESVGTASPVTSAEKDESRSTTPLEPATAAIDDGFSHPLLRPLRLPGTAESMQSRRELLLRASLRRGNLTSSRIGGDPLDFVERWSGLERYVLYNRIAAVMGSLLVMAGWGGAMWAVVANF